MSQIESGRSDPVAVDFGDSGAGVTVVTVLPPRCRRGGDLQLLAMVILSRSFLFNSSAVLDSLMAFASSTIAAGTSPVWTALTKTSCSQR